MDKRDRRTVLICDNDADHSYTLEGVLRNYDYEVVVINDATELLATAKSLKPTAVLANPEMNGFNEHDVCKYIMQGMRIPVMILLDRHSTHRAQIGDCRADEELTKPVAPDTLLTLIAKQITLHHSNPSSL